MSRRAELIAEIADEISCGESYGKYCAAFFMDSLLDDGRITADDVAILLTRNDYSDAHIAVADRLREMVKQSAVEFFTNGRGTDYIDDKLAEERAEAEADAEFDRKYGKGEPDGDAHEEQLIKERAA